MGKNAKKAKPVRFWKWKIAYAENDIHPRVMLKKVNLHKKRKITNAKLHLPKSKDEQRSDVTYFYPNPNPAIKDLPGAYYNSLSNDEQTKFQNDSKLRKWKISDDGKAKMRSSLKEKEKMRKLLAKKKQARRPGNPKSPLANLLFSIKSHFRRKRKQKIKKEVL